MKQTEPEKSNDRNFDHTEMTKILGKKIKWARLEKDITIHKVAMMSHVNRNTIRRLEQGDSGIVLRNLLRIAEVLDVSMADLFAEVEAICHEEKSR